MPLHGSPPRIGRQRISTLPLTSIREETLGKKLMYVGPAQSPWIWNWLIYRRSSAVGNSELPSSFHLAAIEIEFATSSTLSRPTDELGQQQNTRVGFGQHRTRDKSWNTNSTLTHPRSRRPKAACHSKQARLPSSYAALGRHSSYQSHLISAPRIVNPL